MSNSENGTDQRVMVDIETLGLEPGAVIVSIGAATFGTGDRHETFYRSVSLASATNAGLHVDGDTLDWWLSQSGDARSQLDGGDDLADVLAAFNEFVDDAEEVWANSPSFDLRILAHAMEAVGIEPSWEFWQERDYRTLKSLPGRPELPRNGDEHHAMADAVHQAEVAERMLDKFSAEVAEP